MKKRMGQRVMAWVLAFVLLWVAIPAYPAVAAGGVTEDGLRWEQPIPGVLMVVITGYEGESDQVEIPKLIGLAEVIGIAAGAFDGEEQLNKVFIHGGDLFIGEEAFANCGRLEVYWGNFSSDTYEVHNAAFKNSCALMYYKPAYWAEDARHSFGGNPTVWLEYVAGENGTHQGEHGLFTYRKSGGEITITGYVATEPEAVVIPATIEGYPVRRIGAVAFWKNADVPAVTIPYGVRVIEPSSFSNCAKLSQVTIPQSVEEIGDKAFRSCPKLSRVTFQDSPVSIGYQAFAECGELAHIELSNKTKAIGGWAFYKCTLLSQIVIPDSVESIGDAAFSKCTALTTVTLSKGLTALPIQMFADCSALRNLTVPDGVTKIGAGAFARCAALTEMLLPASVTEIGVGAFTECSELRGVTLPAGLTKIPESLFQSCTALRRVSIPAGVTEIGAMAFAGCGNLPRLVIPEKVEKVREKAFVDGVTVLEWEGFPNVLDNLRGVTATVYYHPEKSSSDFPPETYSEGVTFVPFCKEHTWQTIYTVDCEATCTATGEQSIHCVHGDARQNVEGLPALGHDLSPWIATKRPTADQCGSEYRGCYTCHEKEVREIPPVLYGDVDGDSAVTSSDARQVLQYTVQKLQEAEINMWAADVDTDGTVTTTDARLILQYYVGKIKDWP